MKSSIIPRRALLALAAALVVGTGTGTAQAQVATKTEAKCHSALAKGIAKHAAAVAKAMATCRNSLIAGDIPGPCPDTKASDAIAKSTAKTSATAAKKCKSTCSTSGVPCIGDRQCPPNPPTLEQCTAGAKGIVFNSDSMGFPGAYCPAIVGGDLLDPEDIGTCAAGVGDIVADSMLEGIYGSVDGSPALSDAAADCLAAVAKSLPKSAAKLPGTVAKCRNAQLTAEIPLIAPDACETADPKTVEGIAKTVDKFTAAVAAACTDAAVAELDFCGATDPTTVAMAQTCLGDLLEQAAISIEDAEDRDYAPISAINGAYPSTAAPFCGDNLANQAPNQFQLVGEECDGDDDSACPGNCLPPGDIFQCTCGNVRRSRVFANGLGADLDNGWTGKSHNSKVTDRAGFVSEMSNCNCTDFGDTPLDSATCVGTSGDTVCDVEAEIRPRCSHRLDDGSTCDSIGNGNGLSEDDDCRACDAFALNANASCTGDARFCLGGVDTGDRCNEGADCSGGSCIGFGRCLDGPFAGNGCQGNQNCNVCVGGMNAGLTCGTDANCPGGSCAVHGCTQKSCVGGADHDEPCSDNATCDAGNCAETSDCLSQCYDADDVATGPCARQSDCADGERCRGICSSANTCIILRNGAPLPLSAGGTSVCIDSQFHTDAYGTRDIVTGEHAINYELRSKTHLGIRFASPCPVCGGYCEADAGQGGQLAYERCMGTCTGPELECRVGPNTGDACVNNGDCAGSACGKVACRFDADCPSGTCSGEFSPECGGNSASSACSNMFIEECGCRLDLTCSLGPNQGQSCRLEASTAFGTTSSDCPTEVALNISGAGGLAISWTPLTSEAVELESPAPCNFPGYENYTCNCVTGGGQVQQPNQCGAACNAVGPSFGQACVTFTKCVGGSEPGAFCDEDSDCSGGGTCSNNPLVCGAPSTGACSVKRCVAGVNTGQVCFEDSNCPGSTCLQSSCTVGDMAACNSGDDGVCRPDSCTTDGDCDGGATCGDVCPSGRCVPLCVERGRCDTGDKAGLFCAQDSDCPGGGTCVPDDPFEGSCANGEPLFHCAGPGHEFRTCTPDEVGTQKSCEAGIDEVLGTGDDYLGAGLCISEAKNCFFDNGYSEGGDTLNGNGDPTNSLSNATYCIPASESGSVNSTAGLPGPGRIRQEAVVVPNFDSLP